MFLNFFFYKENRNLCFSTGFKWRSNEFSIMKIYYNFFFILKLNNYLGKIFSYDNKINLILKNFKSKIRF